MNIFKLLANFLVGSLFLLFPVYLYFSAPILLLTLLKYLAILMTVILVYAIGSLVLGD